MSSPINPKYPLFLKNIGKFKTTNVTHEELVNLRNSNRLIPGMQYRITDYVATTSDAESRSANHPFDIIVTADDTNILNENARAIQHEGDEYFKNCNLAAWKLKYCLDNDIDRFGWAVLDNVYTINVPYLGDIKANLVEYDDLLKDTEYHDYCYKFNVSIATVEYQGSIYTNTLEFIPQDENSNIYGIIIPDISNFNNKLPIYSIKKENNRINGKGVVYEMIDEYNNRAPYDFKGIQFKRYSVEKYKDNFIKFTHTFAPMYPQTRGNIGYTFVYTFSIDREENIIDSTLIRGNGTVIQNYYIGNSYLDYIGNTMILPNIALITEGNNPDKLFINNNCYNITMRFGNYVEDSYDNQSIYIGNNSNQIHIDSDYSCNVNIGAYCFNLYNIYNCTDSLRDCKSIVDLRKIIIHNMNNYYNNFIHIPGDIIDIIFNTKKLAEVWRNGNNLVWYHPNIDIISDAIDVYMNNDRID